MATENDTSLHSYYVAECADCGAKTESNCWYDHLTKKWMVSCGNCNADSDWQDTKQQAVDSWNDRIAEAA